MQVSYNPAEAAAAISAGWSLARSRFWHSGWIRCRDDQRLGDLVTVPNSALYQAVRRAIGRTSPESVPLGWGCVDHVRAVTLIGLTRLFSCETVPKFSQEQSMSMPPEQPYPAQGATLQQTDLPEEEIPTQRNPRVVMPTQHSSAQEKTGLRLT